MATHKITYTRGTTFVIGIAYTQDGVAQDISGATVRFTVKSVESDDINNDSSALIQKDVSSHTDPTNGITEIVLLPADGAAVDPGDYFYDVKIEFNPTTIYKLDEGRFILDGSPTNRRT